MFQFHKTDTREKLPLQVIMAARSGLETRYINRFSKWAGTTDKTLQDIDAARTASDNARTNAGVLQGQKDSINHLFLKTASLIKQVNEFQSASGSKLVSNVPLPTATIEASYGKKMGYIQLILEFYGQGTLFFMEEILNLKEALDGRDKVIASLAQNAQPIDVIGSLEKVEIEDLYDSHKQAPSSYVKPDQHVPTPPATPKANPSTPVQQTASGKNDHKNNNQKGANGKK